MRPSQETGTVGADALAYQAAQQLVQAREEATADRDEARIWAQIGAIDTKIGWLQVVPQAQPGESTAWNALAEVLEACFPGEDMLVQSASRGHIFVASLLARLVPHPDEALAKAFRALPRPALEDLLTGADGRDPDLDSWALMPFAGALRRLKANASQPTHTHSSKAPKRGHAPS